MTGVMVADILTIKKTIKFYLLVSIFYIAIGIYSGGGLSMISFITFFGIMLVLSTFSYNDLCHWDKFINSAPVKRIDVVAAKYVLAFVCIGVSVVIGTAVITVEDLTAGKNMTEDIIGMGIIGAVGIVYCALMLPVLFKFGAEKARIILIVIFLVPFAILMLTSKNPEVMAKLNRIDYHALMIPGIAAVIALAVISFCISFAIYTRKEF